MIRSSLVTMCAAGLLAAALPAAAATAVQTGERRAAFNDGWRFLKGDPAGAQAPGFNDAQWRALRLPHDWAIEGPFDSKLNPHTGALPIGGTGWYRKAFTLPESARGRYVSIEFDGAMSNARVWINGAELGGRPFGYIGFAFDLTPHLKYGREENVVAVRLAPEERSSRWYPGAGIYRNVWLEFTGPVHIGHWGTYITTPQVTDQQATVAVKTEVRNRSNREARVTVRATAVDAARKPAGSNAAQATIPAGGVQTVELQVIVARPQRWDITNPYLYTLSTVVEDQGGKAALDRTATPFGIRTIAFDKTKGFLLNGRAVKIQGVCNHHDLGALGAAVNRRATERQIEILKGAGVNAIRTSHNPPSPELLELCDRMGVVVMDEIFDMWRIPKVPNGYSKYYDEWSERDVRDFVHRDRNHPSIILWSIGNEIPEQGRADGAKEAKRLTGLFHQEDPTRPTTSAFNSWQAAIKNKLTDEVDVQGFNYQPMQYEGILKDHPGWTILGAETASCVSSRGVYHLPIEKYEKHPSLQLTGYDVIAPPWAMCPDVEFFYQQKLPQVAGEFMWTGFDYLGEPTPYYSGRGANQTDWPARSSYFGMVDLAGFPKDRYYLYQSVWTRKPMVHVLPHWNWENMAGKDIPVMAYSNADEVELFLNGTSLGRKKRGSETWEMPVGQNVAREKRFATRFRLIWQVPYQPGTLRAVAYSGGKQVAVDEVRTAGAPARVKLSADRARIQADGDDLSFITVRIEDKDGNLVPGSANLVKFRVTGAGTIAAVDNGNAATEEPFQASQRKAFSGMALVIVRSKPGEAGRIRVEAASDGLAAGQVEIAAAK